MRVSLYANVDVETTVDVTIDQIAAALSEYVEELRRLEEVDRPVDHAVKTLIGACYSCLSAVTDDMIAEMTSDHRTLIREKIQEQADRYFTFIRGSYV
jgi:hypothetical protein